MQLDHKARTEILGRQHKLIVNSELWFVIELQGGRERELEQATIARVNCFVIDTGTSPRSTLHTPPLTGEAQRSDCP
jgi:hypothetical protein